jgi:hypothetical protein
VEILGTNSGFAPGSRKTTENLDRVGRFTGPSGYKLTSSQQSGIKYANPNVSPYLCVPALFEIKVYIFLLHFFSFDILDAQQTVVCTFAGGFYNIFITAVV